MFSTSYLVFAQAYDGGAHAQVRPLMYISFAALLHKFPDRIFGVSAKSESSREVCPSSLCGG
jgi:hypothetical protein